VVADRAPRRRLIGLLLVLAVAFAAVVGRLTVVQVLSARPYAAMGLSERIHTEILPADRGSIFDRNGNELAMSVPQSTVWADPLLVTDPAQEAETLAPVLGVAEQDVLSRLTQPGQFSYVDRTVPDATADAVRALKLNGIYLLDEPKRFDPDGSLAAPVIGSVGSEDQGLSGLEYEFDSSLTGHAGHLVSEDDPSGKPIPGGFQRLTPATKGSDLVLTLDRSLQYEVEQDLGRQIAATDAKGGMAVVMDTKTGDVLAMASLVNGPDGSGIEPAPSNDVLTTVYEPGSVQKLITISAALQEGVIQPTTVLTIPDHIDVAGSTFRDDTSHPVEQWTPTDVLTASSNVGAITIGRRLGGAGLTEYLGKYGEGLPTDLHFPGESAGLLLAPSKWSGTTIATVPIGQGIAVTAMQLVAAYNTIANGGVYVAPRLVRARIDPQGDTVDAPPSPTHRVVSAQVAREMTAMLTEVTRGGTGTAAAIDGYQVAGKTGTAKKTVEGTAGYKAGAYYASFAGFVPATDPAFTAMVVLDEPSNVYGGIAAAPVFHDIATYALRELEVPPPPPDPDLFDGVPHAQPSAATAADEPVSSDAAAVTPALVDPPPPAEAPPPAGPTSGPTSESSASSSGGASGPSPPGSSGTATTLTTVPGGTVPTGSVVSPAMSSASP
jgi:cell division protein FtsI (penicillin-binding protein 3)